MEFRQRNIKDARWLGVLNAAARRRQMAAASRAASQSLEREDGHADVASRVGTHLASYGGGGRGN